MVQRSERKWRRLYRLAGDAPDNFVTLGQTVRGMRENTGLNVKSRHETGGLRFVMSRLPRLTVPGYPHHVIQRGNNRQPIVVDDADRQRLLDDLAEHARAHGVAVHAYVLMSNHLHLLVTPEAADSVPLMMQGVGRAYVRYFNRRHGRSGTLWEGRYRSTLIEAERHLLACMVYIDLNPVRAGMVATAADYPWSSHGHMIGLRIDPLITPHPLYWALGNTPFARERAYADLVEGAPGSPRQAELARGLRTAWALGGDAFVADLARRTQRRVSRTRPGRPRKAVEDLAAPDQAALPQQQ